MQESLLRVHHSIGSETDTVSGREGARRREREKERRGISEALCIQSNKTCYEAVIQSEAKPTLPQEEKEQAQERERETERDRKEGREREHSQQEKERAEEKMKDTDEERSSREVECIQSEICSFSVH
jgi:hypothetical protein